MQERARLLEDWDLWIYASVGVLGTVHFKKENKSFAPGFVTLSVNSVGAVWYFQTT